MAAVLDVVSVGERIVLTRLREGDIPLCVALRNRTRDGFLDNREIDAAESAAWLLRRRDDPEDTLFAIRLRQDDTFIGTIGCKRDSEDPSLMECGRIAIAPEQLKALIRRFGKDIHGVALDASHALIAYCFSLPEISWICSVHMKENRLAARVNRLSWGTVYRTGWTEQADGKPVEWVEMRLTRATWERESCTKALPVPVCLMTENFLEPTHHAIAHMLRTKRGCAFHILASRILPLEAFSLDGKLASLRSLYGMKDQEVDSFLQDMRLVHVIHDGLASLRVCMRAWILGIPFVLSFQGGNDIHGKAFTPGMRPLLLFTANAAARVTVVCALDAEVLRTHGITAPIDVVPVPIGEVPAPMEEMPAPIAAVPERVPEVTIAFFGRLIRKKGCDIALQALALLPACYRMVVMGDGPERHALEQLAISLDVQTRVTWMGQVSLADGLKTLQRVDVLWYPSRSEGAVSIKPVTNAAEPTGSASSGAEPTEAVLTGAEATGAEPTGSVSTGAGPTGSVPTGAGPTGSGPREDERKVPEGVTAEGTPQAILYAQAMGIPVLAADSGSIREIVQHAKTGFLLPQESPEAFVSCMRELDPEKVAAIRTGAMAQVRARHTEDAVLRVWDAVYEQAMQSAGQDKVLRPVKSDRTPLSSASNAASVEARQEAWLTCIHPQGVAAMRKALEAMGATMRALTFLDAGGQGMVYRLDLPEPYGACVLKIPNFDRQEARKHDAIRRSLLREGTLMASLDASLSSYVPAYVRHDAASGDYLVRAHVEGETLEAYALHHRRQDRLRVLAAYLRMTAVLFQVLHEQQGMVLRDYKNRNIIVEALEIPRLHLIDMGSARPETAMYSKRTREVPTRLGKGKWLFWPPEQLMETPGVCDRRVDYFACGVTCYHLLFQMYPYANDCQDPAEAKAAYLRAYAVACDRLAQAVGEGKSHSFLSEEEALFPISPKLVDFIRKCLHPEAEHRVDVHWSQLGEVLETGALIP